MQETRLNSGVSDAEIIRGTKYKIYRVDRQHTRNAKKDGRGVAIIVRGDCFVKALSLVKRW